MADSVLTTNFSYVYPGILPLEIFFKPTEDTPALSELAVIDTGIRFKKRYNLLNQLDKILKPYGGCTRTFTPGGQEIFNRDIVVEEFEINKEWCKDDFTEQLAGKYNHLAQEWLKSGNSSFDPSGTPIGRIIDQLLEDALRRDVFRRIMFADYADASEDWNTINGMWTQLIDAAQGSSSSYCVRRGADFGLTLSDGEALAGLKSITEGSANILKAIPNSKKNIWVTGSVFENLLSSYESNSTGSDDQFGLLQKGPGGFLQYRGLDVKPIYFWDTLLEDSDNPLFGTVKHLALYTTRDNHVIGTDAGSDLTTIEGWYERKDRKYYFEGDMKMGYTYLHCDLQTIGF